MKTEPTCKVCHGTGIEETGNNDFPCDYCPAGDTVVFNVSTPSGLKQMTGVEVRKTWNPVPSRGNDGD